MHRYQVGEKLGDGTYGEVLRATNKTSGEVVAIKRLRTYHSRSWPHSLAFSLGSSLGQRAPW